MVFDLDGTLLCGGSLLPFLFSYCRRHRSPREVHGLLMDLGLYGASVLSARIAKARLIRRAVGGQSVETIAQHADRFCREWLPNRIHLICIQGLRRRSEQKHRVVLLAASPGLYIPAIASWFEITETVWTRVTFEAGLLLGSIFGDTRKGMAKVRSTSSRKRHHPSRTAW